MLNSIVIIYKKRKFYHRTVNSMGLSCCCRVQITWRIKTKYPWSKLSFGCRSTCSQVILVNNKEVCGTDTQLYIKHVSACLPCWWVTGTLEEHSQLGILHWGMLGCEVLKSLPEHCLNKKNKKMKREMVINIFWSHMTSRNNRVLCDTITNNNYSMCDHLPV